MTQAENRNITNLSGHTRLAGLSNRRSFIGGSDAWLTLAGDEAASLRLCREKRAEAEPEDLAGKPGLIQVCDRPGAKPSTSPVLAAHNAFVTALSGHPPRAIPLDADTLDLEDRADHIGRVFSALSAYFALVLDDTTQNVPGALDLPHVEAILSDLAADVTGAIQHAAEDMGWRIA
jgi:hypothetical protein